jgi:adenine specific DNA methylase Mod
MHIPLGGKLYTDSDKTSNISRSVNSVAYDNVLQGETPTEDFKSWFKERIALMRPLLRLDGFIFVRFDYHFGHYAKIVLDEVFNTKNFVIEFLIRRMKKNLSQKQLNQQTHLIVHNDSLFVYRASEQAILKMKTVKKKKRKSQDLAEIEFSNDNIWLDIAGYQKAKKNTISYRKFRNASSKSIRG